MKSHLLCLVALLLSPLCALSAVSDDLPDQPMVLEKSKRPAPPFETAGGFLGLTADRTFVASGQDSAGWRIWLLPAASAHWTETTERVAGHAAVARWGVDRWIMAGGLRDGRAVADVAVVSVSGGKVTSDSLPPLPEPLVGAGAAILGDKLHVFGGASDPAAFALSKTLWILDLKNGGGWEKGPEFPGEARAFFAAVEQYGMLCVFGGVSSSGRVLAEAWIYRPKPLEGTRVTGWRRMSDLPQPSALATALPAGQAQVILLGGDHSPSATVLPPPVGGDDGGRPLLFHTLTDAWCEFDITPGLEFPAAVKEGQRIFAMGSEGGVPVFLEMVVQRSVRNLVWVDYAVILAYFGLIVGIGWYFSRKQETSAEFSLGNRKVLWWAAGISMFATGASAISFMAVPALAFATNLVWLFPLLVMIPGYFVTAHWIYPMLRRMEITSTYEYLERRFNRPLRVIASFQCIIFQTFARAAVVLVLPSLAISSMTGMNVYLSVLIMGIVTTVYTAIGGFDAVIWTEVFQGVLKFFAPLTMILVAIAALPGGFGEFVQIGLDYSKFDFAIVTTDLTLPAFWILMLGTFLTITVSSAGDQPIIQRVFSAPMKEVRRVNMTFTVCGILIGVISNVVGLAIFAYFRAHPEKFDPAASNDQIVPMFVSQAMPVGMAGVVVAAIFASAMATVASAMNSVATIFTEDFYLRVRPAASDRERLFMLKATSYIVGIIGTAMALLLAAQDLKSMMVVWNQMVALVGGGIVGVYSLGMFSRRANGFGAVCGAVVSVIVTLIVKLYTPLHWGTYIPIAIFSCIAAGYVFSLLRPAPGNLHGLTVFTPAGHDRPSPP
ncbi:MAG: sodium/solute symporter [Terrimicrobiaceae bacterium]|nr:sodium/solute symporter [Terrimicrobiaceae bacterium]